ncbi:MAG: glycosyltransferase [Synechococcaceae cyanobacterium]|nr:glycosyltransferase [Synechococcaceae cyanobacterium]
MVVPTLDSFRLLPPLVDSLRRQRHPRWRVLFIDGPSGADHRAWLEGLCCADPRFSWQPQDPRRPGIFGAMNQGFAAVGSDEWLLFWGSDDRAAGPEALDRAAGEIRSGTVDLLVCTGRYLRPAAGGGGERPDRPTRFSCPAAARGRTMRRALFLGTTPPHQATVIGPGARSLLDRYDEDFRLSADLDYFLRISRFPGLRLRRCDLELVHMATGGVSGVQHRRRLAEVRRAYRRAFGWWWPFPFLMRYVRRMLSLLEIRPLTRRPAP